MDSEKAILIAGLGNPGADYARHRHNIGFRVVERLACRLNLSFGNGDPLCDYAAGRVDDRPLVLLKPGLYMNRSGQAMQQWSRREGIELIDLMDEESEGILPLVVCDDLALPLGSLRLRARGSSGGQNGLDSVIQVLGGEDVPRMRLGIAGGDTEVPPDEWADYVLEPFLEDEEKVVVDLVDRACDALECFLELGLEQAASRFNRRIRPEPE